MHYFLPLARFLEHLGDEGYFTPEETARLIEDARRLSLDRSSFEPDVILEALLNWPAYKNPKIREEIERFSENREEHTRLQNLRIGRNDLLARLVPHLNGERPDIEAAFEHAPEIMTATQAIGLIPPHHPKAIDALVVVLLGHAKRERVASS